MPLLLFIMIVAGVLVFLGWALPHRSQIDQEPTRLTIQRAVLARTVTSFQLVLSGALAAYLLAVFVASREWILVAISAIVVLRALWVVSRSRERGRLVIDRNQNTISAGGRDVGLASELVAVQAAAVNGPGVTLILRELGQPDRGVFVTASDRSDAETIAAAIARFVGVPIVESPPTSRAPGE